MIEQLNQWSPVWANVMWNVAWQSTLLAAAVAAICWLLRRQSPGLRYLLWLALSLKLLLLPFWSINIPAPAWLTPAIPISQPAPTPIPPGLVASATSQHNATPPTPPPTQAANNASQNSPLIATWLALSSASFATWLMILWFAVILFEVARIARQRQGLQQLLAESRAAHLAETLVVEQCSARLGLSKIPTVKITAGEGSPMVCGLRRPTLVLPGELVEQIDRSALRQIVLHELAHLQRQDLLSVWVIQFMRIAYWFNPLAHWIAYRAGLERELACDRLAMITSGVSATTYAHTLIDAASGRSQSLVFNAATAARLQG